MRSSSRRNGCGPVLAAVLVPTLWGCAPGGDEHGAGSPPAELYARYCSGCHGDNGKGIFIKGTSDLTESRLSREQVTALIVQGDSERHRMPNFPRMSRADARGLADHVLRLTAGAPDP